MPGVVDALTRPDVDPQLRHTFTHGFAIAKITCRYPAQANLNLRTHPHVAQIMQPVRDWGALISKLIAA